MLTGEKPNINGIYNIYIPQNMSFSAKSFLLLMLQKKGNERLDVEDLLRHEFINNYNGILNNKKELNYYPYTEKTVSKTKSILRENPTNSSELRLTMQPRYATPIVKIPQHTTNATPIKASKFIQKFNTECKDKDRFRIKSRYDFSTINPIHPGFRAKFVYESKTVDKSQPIHTINSKVLTQPSYKRYKIGNKINGNQLKMIVNCCKKYYLQMKGGVGIAMKASEELKQSLGGNWLIFISNLKCKQFDFNISSIQKGNFVIFSLDKKLFQICKY
jgi:serine/threonine protein kinase